MPSSIQPSAQDLSVSSVLSLVESSISYRFSQRVHEFHIVARNDGLVLEGRTRTYFSKQVLQQAVISAIDLPIVANNIIVGDVRMADSEV